MAIGDIIFFTSMYVLFTLSIRALLIDEEQLDNPTRWAISVLWPVFLIKYIFVGIVFTIRGVPKIMKKIFVKWQVVPMFLFHGFSRAMKLLVTGKIPT